MNKNLLFLIESGVVLTLFAFVYQRLNGDMSRDFVTATASLASIFVFVLLWKDRVDRRAE